MPGFENRLRNKYTQYSMSLGLRRVGDHVHSEPEDSVID